jgi:hypothetical protein
MGLKEYARAMASNLTVDVRMPPATAAVLDAVRSTAEASFAAADHAQRAATAALSLLELLSKSVELVEDRASVHPSEGDAGVAVRADDDSSRA